MSAIIEYQDISISADKILPQMGLQVNLDLSFVIGPLSVVGDAA